MVSVRKNGSFLAWDKCFQAMPILETIEKNGFFDITSEEMNRYGEYEARNMAKMDFREKVPPIMKEHGLAVLAIKNKIYRIAKFDPFIEIPPRCSERTNKIEIPHKFLTLTPKNLTNECRVLDAAKVSGVLDKAFGEKVELTIRGRSYSPDFDLQLNNVHFPISSVQVEVDGGYEGNKTINLVEAKIGGRGNISIRQLLYPQRIWESTVGNKKKVKTFVCLYDAPVLRIIPINFEKDHCSVDSHNEQCFQIEPNSRIDIMSIQENINAPLPRKGKPFPQADKFETIIALFTRLSASEEQQIDKKDLFEDFDFSMVDRQADYYANVLVWLGLAELKKQKLCLTAFGSELGSAPHSERIRELAGIIFAEPVCHWTLHHNLSTVDDELMSRFSRLWKVESLSTADRRLQTIRSWIKYFKDQTNLNDT